MVAFNKPFKLFDIKNLVVKKKLANNSEVAVTTTDIGYNQSRVMIWFTVSATDDLKTGEKFLLSTQNGLKFEANTGTDTYTNFPIAICAAGSTSPSPKITLKFDSLLDRSVMYRGTTADNAKLVGPINQNAMMFYILNRNFANEKIEVPTKAVCKIDRDGTLLALLRLDGYSAGDYIVGVFPNKELVNSDSTATETAKILKGVVYGQFAFTLTGAGI